MSAEQELIIPFGKYKDKPVSVLRSDPQYVQWMKDNKVLDKYPAINTVIINNFREPEDTPAHNELQMRFLDRSFVYSVGCAFRAWRPFAFAYDQFVSHMQTHRVSEPKLEFEWRGWDVYARFDSFSISGQASRPEYLVELWDLQVGTLVPRDDLGPDTSVKSYEPDYYESRSNRWKVTTRETWGILTDRKAFEKGYIKVSPSDSKLRFRSFTAGIGGRLCCEIKPSLGEDFPAILRQVKSRRNETYTSGLVCAVLVDEFVASSTTFENVQTMFALDGIPLLRVSDIPQLRYPFSPSTNAKPPSY